MSTDVDIVALNRLRRLKDAARANAFENMTLLTKAHVLLVLRTPQDHRSIGDCLCEVSREFILQQVELKELEA